MPKNKFLRIFAVVIAAVLLIVLVVFGFNLFQGVFSRASFEKPENVTISDTTANSAKISWTTSAETSGGIVKYGVSPNSLTSFAPSESTRSKEHSVVLTLLSANTAYYFVIAYGESDDKTYDNAGVPWTFTTKSSDGGAGGSGARPSPIQTLEIPDEESAPNTSVCGETDCSAIKAKLGKGCSTQDYMRCIKNPTGTP